ncbi:hypothetical protein [Ralstonia pseudosolanacearum]|uniref:hypothetical protein n=1 Tax=Ralstonia pseudosolanacearum TaxID=1310165 RepID=UPI001586725A|nr:hypothetical protein [Ralstonia pseudosolanacearum]
MAISLFVTPVIGRGAENFRYAAKKKFAACCFPSNTPAAECDFMLDAHQAIDEKK